MRRFISRETIKLEKNVIKGLRTFCKERGLDTNDLFLYYDDDTGIHVGFDDNEDNHIPLDEHHWIPVNEHT